MDPSQSKKSHRKRNDPGKLYPSAVPMSRRPKSQANLRPSPSFQQRQETSLPRPASASVRENKSQETDDAFEVSDLRTRRQQDPSRPRETSPDSPAEAEARFSKRKDQSPRNAKLEVVSSQNDRSPSQSQAAEETSTIEANEGEKSSQKLHNRVKSKLRGLFKRNLDDDESTTKIQSTHWTEE
ncbi:MAG: hypothetical protein M1828_000261 [Chrysothrix sp. TS-e1954]|nr:MAG: hypothetical protein M1828_000261 [Chrysothrix sp. TS-e1954]